MSTCYEDRYYEPEDDDYEDMDEYIDDYVAYEMRKGGDLDPMEQSNFLEAMSQLGLPEEIENWEDATKEQQKQVIEYWEDVARFRGEESYYDNL
jgi:hypothetical protein